MKHKPPLIAHIILRLHIGGLENGLVNLINHTPGDRYHHAIVCLAGYTDFRERIRNKNVPVFTLDKKNGKDFGMYVRLWRLLRQLRPDIVHTRNLAAMDSVLSAAVAGVPCRIHGEHGWDVYDLFGKNFKYNLIRRACRPLIHRYIALSKDIERWLASTVHVSPEKLSQIYNGVDTERFYPCINRKSRPVLSNKIKPDHIVIGTVGRLAEVKNQISLVHAFEQLIEKNPNLRNTIRLAIIGDGPNRNEIRSRVKDCGIDDLVWMPGPRDNVEEILRALDIFVLPSLNEGISNTILEAMASGLPVIATEVGGNPELIEPDRTGLLVSPSDPAALADAIGYYLDNPAAVRLHGETARHRVKASFSLDAMINSYLSVYDSVLEEKPLRGRQS